MPILKRGVKEINKNLEVNILVNNTVYKKGFLAEHGLSFHFKYQGKEYLFDTGHGETLFFNAEKLAIDLKNIDTIFLSHGHDDHTGGLKRLLQANHKIRVFAHSDLFLPKHKKIDNHFYFNGVKIKKTQITNFQAAEKNKKAAEGIYSITEIKTSPKLYKDFSEKRCIIKNNKKKVDLFNDENTIFIESEKGIVILLGCSHKGVVNIIDEIRSKLGDKKIKAILGGMHLKTATKKEVTEIIDYFKLIDFDLLVPIHCTGRVAALRFKEAFGEKVKLASVGDKFKF